MFHDFMGDGYTILFSHPADYTPVCTTELAEVSKRAEDWSSRNTKVCALSCCSVEDHKGWIKDVNCFGNTEVTYPIIADEDRSIATMFGMLGTKGVMDDKKGMPMTVRCVFIFGPDKKLKLTLTYPPSTGRNFDEIIRVLDSIMLSDCTPVNWKVGDMVVVHPSKTDE